MSFFWTRRMIEMDYISSSDSEDEDQKARIRFSHELFLQFMHNMTPEYMERQLREDKLASQRLEDQRQQELQTRAREQERANKEAAELLQCEEMLQRKREKNQKKKKKKKKAKQDAKKHLEAASQGNPVPTAEMSAAEEEEEESATNNETETSLNEEIDPNSAFAAKSMQKANIKPESANSGKQAKPMDKCSNLRRLATSLISEGFLTEAISILSQAIAICPEDGKIYLERAECLLKLGKFEEVLRDALVNVERNPRSSQGYKLACKAYLSLKQYDKAHEAIMKAKEIEGYTEDVQGGIKRTGVLKLTDMGFDEDKAVSAMEKKRNFQDALDELLGGLEQLKLAKSTKVEEWEDWSEDQEENAVGYTPVDGAKTTKVDEWDDWSEDQEESADVNTTKAVALPSTSGLEYQDRSVSDSSRSVWVGSVSPSATWNDLNVLFLTCGTIHNLHKPLHTNYAFVNFTTSSEACQAIAKFNNYEFFGEKLVVRLANSSQKPFKTPSVTKPATPKKNDPRNPLGVKSLYVANVMPKMTEKELHNIFSSCGHVTSCQILREKRCAFVNYAASYEATKALETLQNFRYKNVCLVLKFPKNTEHTVIGKKRPNIPLFAVPEPPVQEVISVPTGECEFWRKGECVFGGKCWLAHVPEHQGVDA